MPKYIIKLEDEGQSYYLEWSTIVDAPVSIGMLLDEFKIRYKHKYGTEGMKELDERLERVNLQGTSALHYLTVDVLLELNRAGPEESHLNMEGIIEKYIREPIKMNKILSRAE